MFRCKKCKKTSEMFIGVISASFRYLIDKDLTIKEDLDDNLGENINEMDYLCFLCPKCNTEFEEDEVLEMVIEDEEDEEEDK